MKNLMMSVALLAMSACGSVVLAAEEKECGTVENVIDQWAEEFNEFPVVIGRNHEENAFILFVDPVSGSWTVFHGREGVMCMSDYGMNLKVLSNLYIILLGS